MKKVVFVSVLLFIFLTSCSEQPISKTPINIRIDGNGTLYLNGKEIQSPIYHSAIEEIFGQPSKIINRQPYRDYVWDQLGLATSNYKNGELIKLNLKFRGQLGEEERDPKLRFNGSLTIPTGVFEFPSKHVKTDGLGFQPMLGSNDVLFQVIGGVEVVIAGAALKIGKPKFVSISFSDQ